MVPKHERRHRLNSMEINPVKVACYHKLLYLLEARAPEDLLKASALFRVWWRIHTYCRNKPKYPNHDSWESISAYLRFGTVTRKEGD